MPTGSGNLFERASAIGHIGLGGAIEHHSRAGDLYEDGELPATHLRFNWGDYRPCDPKVAY